MVTHTPQAIPVQVLADVRVLPPKRLNTSGFLVLNHFSRQTAWAHGFMHNYALWLGPVLLAIVFAAVYAVAWWRRVPRVAALLFFGGIGTVVALGLNQLGAHSAKELRPYAAYPHALVLVAKTTDYSFPSDHSIIAGGLTLSVLLVLDAKVWRCPQRAARSFGEIPSNDRGVPGIVGILAVASVLLGLFLCFARVYVGAHYPGDVVAGYLLSSAVVILLSLLRPLAYRAIEVIEPTVLGTLLRRPDPSSTPPTPTSKPLVPHIGDSRSAGSS